VQIKPTRIPDGTGKMVNDYWESAKKFILSDPQLLKSLRRSIT
jgi:hypothetical protein